MSVVGKVLLLAAAIICSAGAQDTPECECVDYFLCVNGTIVTDGTDVLDVRFKTCPGIQVCCVLPSEPENPNNNISPTPPTNTNTEGASVNPPITPVTQEPKPPSPSPIPDSQDGLQIPNIAPGGGCGRRRYPADLGTGLKVTPGDQNLPHWYLYPTQAIYFTHHYGSYRPQYGDYSHHFGDYRHPYGDYYNVEDYYHTDY